MPSADVHLQKNEHFFPSYFTPSMKIYYLRAKLYDWAHLAPIIEPFIQNIPCPLNLLRKTMVTITTTAKVIPPAAALPAIRGKLPETSFKKTNNMFTIFKLLQICI